MANIKVKKLSDKAILPRYCSEGAAGADVTACVEAAIEIKPMERVAIPTGLSFEIPEGFEIQVRPRSGLALKEGLSVINAPGTIDSDYRGEIKILVVNLGAKTITIRPGDRIAQLVLQEVPRATFLESSELSDTVRSVGGFGSTGKHHLPT